MRAHGGTFSSFSAPATDNVRGEPSVCFSRVSSPPADTTFDPAYSAERPVCLLSLIRRATSSTCASLARKTPSFPSCVSADQNASIRLRAPTLVSLPGNFIFDARVTREASKCRGAPLEHRVQFQPTSTRQILLPMDESRKWTRPTDTHRSSAAYE